MTETAKPTIYSSMTDLAKAAVKGDVAGQKIFIAKFKGEECYVPARGPSGAHAAYLKGIAEQVEVRAMGDTDLFQAIADLAKGDDKQE